MEWWGGCIRLEWKGGRKNYGESGSRVFGAVLSMVVVPCMNLIIADCESVRSRVVLSLACCAPPLSSSPIGVCVRSHSLSGSSLFSLLVPHSQFSSGLLRTWMFFKYSLIILFHNKDWTHNLLNHYPSEPFNHRFLLWVVFLTSPFLSFILPSLNCSSVSHNFYNTFLKICPRAKKNEGKSYKKQFPRRLQQEEVICSSFFHSL